ncbi:MAG: glycosyltransferase [Lachnospiraceae bacterium]|nr:glycosyltransferase [Lachnospiraceae bacterium]
MKFSIITASYNPGDKLVKTMNSILDQTFTDYQVIIKDGVSKDGSLGLLEEDSRLGEALATEKILVICQKDKSVYDAMNQAAEYVQGDYILYLNCGDVFFDKEVLERVTKYIDNAENSKTFLGKGAIFYGNTFCSRTGVMVHSAPKITGFTCYRNIPCHQSCFYSKNLIQEKKYDDSLKIRADYDHFLWAFYEKEAEFYYMDTVISDYEGGGISESKENQSLDKREHELIIKRYMKKSEIAKYKTIMFLTLAPLRRWIAESTALSGIYHRLKEMIYRNK